VVAARLLDIPAAGGGAGAAAARDRQGLMRLRAVEQLPGALAQHKPPASACRLLVATFEREALNVLQAASACSAARFPATNVFQPLCLSACPPACLSACLQAAWSGKSLCQWTTSSAPMRAGCRHQRLPAHPHASCPRVGTATTATATATAVGWLAGGAELL
jgi:hypothetical protein